MHHPKAFANYVPIAVMGSRFVSTPAKLVYVHALWRMRKEKGKGMNKHRYSTSRIADDMGISPAAVKRAFRELAVLGLVKCPTVYTDDNARREVYVCPWSETLELRLRGLVAPAVDVLAAVKDGRVPVECFDQDELPVGFPLVEADVYVPKDTSSVSGLGSPVSGPRGHP